jgi:hypothetical protein
VTTTHPSTARDQAGPEESGPVEVKRSKRASRPLYLAGVIAACAAALAGLAALTLVAAIGWIAAPHATVGGGLPGVLRTAIQLWLVGHHVGFDLHAVVSHGAVSHGAGSDGAGSDGAGSDGAGPFGLLPLGLLVLPGALLWRSGRWVVRATQVARLRHAGLAALALAVPYGLLTGSLAVASRTGVSAPSPVQAALAGFLLAIAAGGLGALRALAPWARLIALLPERARCLVVGVTGSLAVLAGTGALLVAVSLIVHAGEFKLASDELSPGLVGSALLLLAALAYLPNAVIWGIAYMLGPGFAFGVGTVVAPTGTLLGPLPLFPMLAVLPAGSLGPHPAAPGLIEPVLLAVPFLAGAFGGVLTARAAPTPSLEIAPLWGLASGVLCGAVIGALAAFSGGPLGTGRLATTGPSGWQVALVAALELGIAAAITAGLTNWLLIHRRSAAERESALALAPATSTSTDHTSTDHTSTDHTSTDHTSTVRLIGPANSNSTGTNLATGTNPANVINPLSNTSLTGPTLTSDSGPSAGAADAPVEDSGRAITFDSDPEPMLASARSRVTYRPAPAVPTGPTPTPTSGPGLEPAAGPESTTEPEPAVRPEPEPVVGPEAVAEPEGSDADSGEAGGRVIYLVPRSGEARDAGERLPSSDDE